MKITSITSQEILDSKGQPTVEVEVELEDGTKALAQVPSGASTGSSEATEIRDNNPDKYFGKGVTRAVENVNTKIRSLLVEHDADDQVGIDQMMIEADGTPNKSFLGGNAITGVSMAVCRAAAVSQKKELYEHIGELSGNNDFDLPQPMILLMEGGKHGNWATDIQEFMVMPNPDLFVTFRDNLEVGAELFHILGEILVAKDYDAGVGFEGAYAPRQLKSNEEAFDLIIQAIEKAGLIPGRDIKLAVDVAASEFFENGQYVLKSENNTQISSEEWMQRVISWSKNYPFKSIEDPFDQKEWQMWTKLMDELGSAYQIVGDDLVTTNPQLIQKAIDLKAMNSTLIKVNQIGTVTETIEAIQLSQSAGYTNIVSHRGGETNDDFIADLVVGTTATQCKFGGPDRGERLAKYNRLLRIENQLTD